MFGRTKSNISNGNFPFSEINDKNLNFGRDYTLGDFIYEDLLHCTAVTNPPSFSDFLGYVFTIFGIMP